MSQSPAKPNLVYTVAFDRPGEETYRLMAKMLVASLIRTGFTGEIVVFRNSDEPLIRKACAGLREICVADEEGYRFKYRAREWIDGSRYDRILFLDCDCLVLRNVDHLLEGDWDLAWQPEMGKSIQHRVFNAYLTDEEMERFRRDGANSGVWAVRGDRFREVMEEWDRLAELPPERELHAYDQPAWNRLLLDTPLRTRPLERLEVMFPMYRHPCFKQYREAAVLHVCGTWNGVKTEFLTGLFLQKFLNEEGRRLIETIEP